MNHSYTVFLGLDVGKGEHHAVGLDPAGKRLHDALLPNTEPKLRAMFDKLAAHGPILVVVDQPATIGALPVAVARAWQARRGLPARLGDAPDRRSLPRQR